MEKNFSRLCSKLIFAAMLSSVCVIIPPNAIARRIPFEQGTLSTAQTVKGTIKDASTDKPLAGASVALKGTTQSTSSDVNGAFTIDVPDNNSILVISFVGFVTREVVVGSETQLDIALQSTSGDLAQVVVVGYGTQNKKDITGAVKSIKSESFNRGIINTPQELLQGKVAGVNVTSSSGEPGAPLAITIRGPGGVRTGSTPLFVVDGLALDNSSTGGGDPLNFLNPQDIESFDVLKDASATAIYGSRGANGVIIITTKRGKAGVSTLAFSTSLGVSKMARPIDVFTADEFRAEVPKIGGVLDDQKASTDWQKVVSRTALTQNHNLTLSGGANKLTYYASFGAQIQQGVIKKSELNRYSGRFNATQKFLDDRLIMEVNLNVANTKTHRPPNVIADAVANNPTYPAYDANGDPSKLQNLSNPLVYFDLLKELTTINRVIGNISPSFKITKALVYKLNFGVDNSNGTRDVVELPNAVPLFNGRLETYITSNRNTLIENYLTYTLEKGNHDLSALAGHSYQKIHLHGRNSSINRFPISPVDPLNNPGLGQELTLAANRPGGYALINELQSYFGRVTYQYNNKYLLTVNFRADGSSKFGANNKYGYFPSFSLGWKISDENFLSNSVFSNLKLRAGWGRTGNQEIPSKITQAFFTSQVSAATSYPLLPAPPYPAGTTYSRLANPNIQWESSEQTNVGLDFGFWNGNLSGSLDVFSKNSKDLLLEVIPADPVQPAGSFWTNVEDMVIKNQGVEFDIEYRHKAKTGINFNIGGNVTYMTNEVKNSPYSVIPSGAASGSGLTSATINGYLNNEPIGTFYLLDFIGFDNNGLSVYRDLNKDNITSDKDRIAAGSALPNLLYGFYGGANHKGFDLNINFNGVSGNKIYDNTANSNFYKAKLVKNVNTTREAISDAKESTSNAARVSTRYLKDGAYLRLNSLALGYSFNTGRLGIKWLTSLRLSVTGQNLFVITDYDGYDPEVNTDRTVNGISSYGIDYLSYPKARSIIFGLSVSF